MKMFEFRSKLSSCIAILLAFAFSISSMSELKSNGDDEGSRAKAPEAGERFVGIARVEVLESSEPESSRVSQAVNIDASGMFVASMATDVTLANAKIRLSDGQTLVPVAAVLLPKLGVVVFCVDSEKDLPVAAWGSPKKAEGVQIHSAQFGADDSIFTNGLVSNATPNRFQIDTATGALLREGIVYSLEGKCLGVVASNDGPNGGNAVTMDAVKEELVRLVGRFESYGQDK